MRYGGLRRILVCHYPVVMNIDIRRGLFNIRIIRITPRSVNSSSVHPGCLIILLLLGLSVAAEHLAAAQPVSGSVNITPFAEAAPVPADLSADGRVDLEDFRRFSPFWLADDCGGPDWCMGTDMDRTGVVDINDLVAIAGCWLMHYDVVVPAVTGMTQAEAEAAITAAGLVVGTIWQQFSTTVPAGSIVSQVPSAGQEVPPKSTVDLVLSRGIPITVPDVTGLTSSQAQAAIASADLELGSVTQEPSAVFDVGRIGRQSPVAGEQVSQGTVVNLFVSTGPTCFYVAKDGSDQNDGSAPVDQGDGVGPFATIQQGLTVLANRDAVGDVLYIRGGTYFEECTEFGGINAVGPVVIRNYENEQVCIDGGHPVTGWMPCDPNETGVRVCGLMPPGWNSDCLNVYKAQVPASSVYTIPDRPYYGVKLVYENELLYPCGAINMPIAAFPDLENYGWTMTSGTTVSIRDVAHLTEPNGFWNGAFVWFTGKKDNIAYCRRITDSNSLNNTITFDVCEAGADPSKKYWIYNHPHYLNDPGEYYWDPNDADGCYTIYYYARPGETLSDLNSRMKVLSKTAGIRFSVSSSHLIIDGLTFRNCQTRGGSDYLGRSISGGPTGQCGFICATNWCNTMMNLAIRNCTFENFYGNEGGAIVFGECENDIVIDNCTIRDIGRGAGIRTFGESTEKTQGVIIKNCTLERVWGSNIRPYFADNVQITGNTVSQFDGVHGNAVTIYGSCDNVLIAHNIITGGTNALVMKDTRGMYIFGNVFRSTDDSGSVSVWNVDYRPTTGPLYVLHNTILTSSAAPKALFFLGQSISPAADVVVKNNILDGFEYGSQWNPLVTHDSNLYLEQSTHQSGRCSWCSPWVYGSSEIVNINGHADEFIDYTGGVYTLRPASNAAGAGAYISDERAVLEAAFPAYDFSVDLNGNPWQSPPSMGAFEPAAP
jgi:hypothetical protein